MDHNNHGMTGKPMRHGDEDKMRRMKKLMPLHVPENVIKQDGSVLLTSLLRRKAK